MKDNRRDASLEESDSFSFILDTFNDDQNGLVFGTNPMGAEYDAQVRNQAEGSWGSARLSVGSGGNYNINWDASWEVASIIHDKGWSAEFKIPSHRFDLAKRIYKHGALILNEIFIEKMNVYSGLKSLLNIHLVVFPWQET